MRDDFAVFILSHKRANNVLTISTLKKAGYTGKWYIILDNKDEQIEKYIENYGNEHIVIFSKDQIKPFCDTIDNFIGDQTPLFARNVCHKIAKDLNLNYFLELDDDYGGLAIRYEDNDIFKRIPLKKFDELIDYFIYFLDSTNLKCICLAQIGDYIGGANSKVYKEGLSRKAMNCFFCKTSRPFKFIGRLNDDVNTYTELGKKGNLFLTIGNIAIDQLQTQLQPGGLTEPYIRYGTYVKSFYSVILNPSFVKISLMGTTHPRIHHRINWENAVPKIINEKYRKEKIK